MKRRADFIYEIMDGVICIIDQNLGNVSVTNDAENVLANIEMLEGSLEGMPVVYRDSEKVWDQIIGWPDEIGFKSLNARSMVEAMAKVKET